MIGITNYIFKNSKKYLNTQEALDDAIKKEIKYKISNKRIDTLIDIFHKDTKV
jgi:hypothetical protein